MKEKLTYCFDMDGTICTLTTGHDFHKAEPIPGMVKKINRLYDEGHMIIVATARGHVTRDGYIPMKQFHELTKIQLKKWGVNYHGLYTKPLAHFYIDDRAMTPEEFINAHEP